jgi:hypothetical protein
MGHRNGIPVRLNTVLRALPAIILLALPMTADADAVVVGKARIEIGVRKSLHFLGENVLVDFCVVNADATPLVIEVGGDYRGSTRSLRFKVEVRDAKGVAMADPDPEPFNLGGIGYSPKIEPGGKWCQSLALGRYARIDAPGRYTITATHDLGWPAKKAPSGTAIITYAIDRRDGGAAAEQRHISR